MNKSIGILAGVLGMGLAFTAEAQTSGPFNTTTPIPATATDWNGTLVFPQFNSALGTLNSVELFFSSSTTTFLTVQNISNLFGVPSSSSGTAFSDVQLTIQDAGNNLTAPTFSVIRNFAFTLAPGGSVNSGSLSQTGTTSSLYTQSSILAEFTGAGNISLSASTFTQSGLTYTGGITFANVTSVDASLTGSVVYNYTPVPEPTTLALAGLGGLSLMLVLRQRK